MKCPNCKHQLQGRNSNGDTVLRTRALVLKSGGILLVCPKCKGDVQVTSGVAGSISRRLLLLDKRG